MRKKEENEICFHMNNGNILMKISFFLVKSLETEKKRKKLIKINENKN